VVSDTALGSEAEDGAGTTVQAPAGLRDDDLVCGNTLRVAQAHPEISTLVARGRDNALEVRGAPRSVQRVPPSILCYEKVGKDHGQS